MGTGKIKGNGSKLVVSIPANTYSTIGEALTAMYSSFSALSQDQKACSYILYSESGVFYIENVGTTRFGAAVATPTSTWNIRVQTLRLSPAHFYEATVKSDGTTTLNDRKDEAQTMNLSLYTTI